MTIYFVVYKQKYASVSGNVGLLQRLSGGAHGGNALQ